MRVVYIAVLVLVLPLASAALDTSREDFGINGSQNEKVYTIHD